MINLVYIGSDIGDITVNAFNAITESDIILNFDNIDLRTGFENANVNTEYTVWICDSNSLPIVEITNLTLKFLKVD